MAEPDAPEAAERQAFCAPAHPMVLAAYREMIMRWIRQRREIEVIEAARAPVPRNIEGA